MDWDTGSASRQANPAAPNIPVPSSSLIPLSRLRARGTSSAQSLVSPPALRRGSGPAAGGVSSVFSQQDGASCPGTRPRAPGAPWKRLGARGSSRSGSGYISKGGCGRGKHRRDQNDCRASPGLPKRCGKRSQPVWTEGSAAPPAPLPAALPGASTGSCSRPRGCRHQPRFILLIAASKSPARVTAPRGRLSAARSGFVLDLEALRQKKKKAGITQCPLPASGCSRELPVNWSLPASRGEGNPSGKRWSRSRAGLEGRKENLREKTRDPRQAEGARRSTGSPSSRGTKGKRHKLNSLCSPGAAQPPPTGAHPKPAPC